MRKVFFPREKNTRKYNLKAAMTNSRVMKNRLKSFKYLICLYLYWHESHIYLFILKTEKKVLKHDKYTGIIP